MTGPSETARNNPVHNWAWRYIYFGESWDRKEASRILTQLLVDKITSTRRFAVIDREFIDVTQQEASLKVNNPLMPMTQLLELANRLVAEYMIVGQLESITATRTTNYVEILKRDVYSTALLRRLR